MKLVSFWVVALILVKGIFTSSFDDQDGYSTLYSVPGPKSIELTNSDSCESTGNTSSSSVPISSSHRNFHAFKNYHEQLCAQILSMSHRIISQMQENTYNFVKHQQKLDEQIKLLLEMTTADSVPSETITSPVSNSSDEYSSSSDVTFTLLTGNLSPIDGISFKIPSSIIPDIEANQLSPTFVTSATTSKRLRSSGNEFLKPAKKRISE